MKEIIEWLISVLLLLTIGGLIIPAAVLAWRLALRGD